MAALRIIERHVVLSRHDPAHPRLGVSRELAVPAGARGVEVHASLDLVGAAVCEKHVDHPPHRGDLVRGMRHHVGLAPAEATHVGEDRAFLTAAEIAPAHAFARRALQDRFVDIGDVLRVTDGLAGGLEMANKDVEREERPRMAEVRRVIWRDTADV